MSRRTSRIATLMVGFTALATLALAEGATDRPPLGPRKAVELVLDKSTANTVVMASSSGTGSNGE